MRSRLVGGGSLLTKNWVTKIEPWLLGEEQVVEAVKSQAEHAPELDQTPFKRQFVVFLGLPCETQKHSLFFNYVVHFEATFLE